MEVCLFFGGVRHCWFIPVLRSPWVPVHGPGPVDYPAFLSDVSVVASIHEFANGIQDERVKAALHQGIQGAVQAMQAHLGKDAQVQMRQVG